MSSIEETFVIGDELEVKRMGYGAMRLTGDGVWGHPPDRESAAAVLRRTRELGVNLIDTADAYGPETNEYLIAEVLGPYDDDLWIATKGGLVRNGPNEWHTDGRPEHLERAVNNSLRRLDVDAIDLYQLHAIDDDVPLEDSLGAILEMQDAGKIRHIGVSNFNVEQLQRAREVVDVVTVQNRYNLGDREHDPVVDYCTREGIGFIPWYPLAVGELAEDDRLNSVAEAHDASQAQIALAWLLHRSPVVLPIPGTTSISHLEDNVAAADIALSDDEVQQLDDLSGGQ